MRQEPDRRGRIPVGEGQLLQVDELAACLVEVRHEGEIRRSPLRVERVDPSPQGDVLPRGRPERPQVHLDEVGQALLLRGVDRSDPVLREREAIGPAALPRPRWRHAHQRHPVAERPDEALREVAELLDGLRAVGERLANLVRGRLHPPFGWQRLGAQRPLLLGPLGAHRELPVVAPRNHVDRGSHEGRLDDGAVLEGPGQVIPLEPGHARPEPHVAGRRVLRLEPADPLDGLGQRDPGPLEEQLTLEERPIQDAPRQDGRVTVRPASHVRCQVGRWSDRVVDEKTISPSTRCSNCSGMPGTAFANQNTETPSSSVRV